MVRHVNQENGENKEIYTQQVPPEKNKNQCSRETITGIVHKDFGEWKDFYKGSFCKQVNSSIAATQKSHLLFLLSLAEGTVAKVAWLDIEH